MALRAFGLTGLVVELTNPNESDFEKAEGRLGAGDEVPVGMG
ncbi:hypothetical protein BH09VER1_BH09VER1_49030 [soil metagenome]